MKVNGFLPKVSIIIPVYNGASYLQQAIDSALAQSYRNCEVLVINDGSDDEGATEAIALSYGNKIRYFNKPKGGIASALNVGITRMLGDYFSWLSPNALYVKDKIVQQVSALSQLNDDKAVLYSNYFMVTPDSEKEIECKLEGEPPEQFRYWLTLNNGLHQDTLLIPRTAFAECGVFNEQLQSTYAYDLWFRMARKYSFVHLPFSLVKVCSTSEQKTMQNPFDLQEGNHLLTHFVKELTVQEIERGSSCSAGLAYAKMASNLWDRNFFAAGEICVRFSLKHSIKAFWNEIVLAPGVLLKGGLLHYVIVPTKKILFSHFRLWMKQFIKTTIPTFKQKWSQNALRVFKELNLKGKFSAIYEQRFFKKQPSSSAKGSELAQTATIRQKIPLLLEELKVSSMLDAPCGDGFWMKHNDLNVQYYIGVDSVAALIDKNQKEYGNDHIYFKCADLITERLPKVDLILSRDYLVHLSYKDGLKMIENFKASGAKYLLATTFTDRDSNEDLGAGFGRTLNLQLPPFNFPPPLALINEGREEDIHTDKSLGLWRLEDLPVIA